MVGYVPERGHIVWVEFSSQSGHGQRGHRPALVLSPAKFNRKLGLAILCPITSKVMGLPFEVPLEDCRTEGVVLADQVKSLDWRSRNVEFIEHAPAKVISDVADLIVAIIH